MQNKINKTENIVLRVASTTKKNIQEQAQKAGISMSEYVINATYLMLKSF